MKKFIRAVAATPELNDNGRIVRYMFSDNSVARDNHTINTNGWQLDNFLLNPVFLWAHDANALPIGRVVDIGVTNGKLMGNVEYLDRDTYPFADTVYQMVRSKYLNATSVSWMPLDYKYSLDKSRPGGIDFLTQELLEISQVPVPAMPSALAAARASGIDTAPMHEWLERALDTGGLAMVPRTELEELRRASKMPAIVKPPKRMVQGAKKRGLYSVSWLAQLVNELGYATADANWETEYEGDDSKVPGQLLEALKLLGAALVAMTIEEVSELLTGLGGEDVALLVDDEAQEVYVQGAKTPAQKILRTMEVSLRRGAPGDTIALVERFIRAGKVLSAANEKTLRAAHGAITDAAGSILALCDAAGAASDGDGDDDATQERSRRARALQLRVKNLIAD